MAINKLNINNIRNINNLKISPHKKINLFYGANGSGKTSILEGIYLLGLGRSFRTHLSRRIIQDEREGATVYAELDGGIALGIEKSSAGKTVLRIQGENQKSAEKLAEYLPLQLINPDGFRLLEDGPKLRRQFLDWGVFHVEHFFMENWRRAQQALKQRNTALRNQLSQDQVMLWDPALIKSGEALDDLRAGYFARFSVVLSDILPRLLDYDDLKVRYYRGWGRDVGLGDVLKERFYKDRQLGYTGVGPHRADLRITVGKQNTPAVDVLSRGQQKLLACALRLTHGFILREKLGKSCAYLVDDLAAELDETRRCVLAEALLVQEAQVFITGVDAEVISSLFSEGARKMFHVEHGEVKSV